jgi:hypothetical protein
MKVYLLHGSKRVRREQALLFGERLRSGPARYPRKTFFFSAISPIFIV